MSPRLLLPGALVFALTLAGCSATTAPTEGTAASEEINVLTSYFEAVLTTTSPADIIKGKDFAAPGSNAEAYAIEQSAHNQAKLDAGLLEDSEGVVLFEEGEVLYCDPGYDFPDVDRADYCVSYTNFEFVDGKLAEFDAGGTPLEGRISLGDPEPIMIGNIGQATVIASYETVGGDLVIVLEVTSATSLMGWGTYDTVYVGVDGRQMLNSSADGPYELKDGRTANIAFLFSEAKIGGQLEVEFYDEGYNNPVTISFPTM
jgi:hypothetical protein